jgi:hypothetical protein
VYDLGDRAIALQSTTADGFVADANGGRWHVTEEELVLEGESPARLTRVVAVRAFWFGWVAQFPQTLLIK